LSTIDGTGKNELSEMNSISEEIHSTNSESNILKDTDDDRP